MALINELQTRVDAFRAMHLRWSNAKDAVTKERDQLISNAETMKQQAITHYEHVIENLHAAKLGMTEASETFINNINVAYCDIMNDYASVLKELEGEIAALGGTQE